MAVALEQAKVHCRVDHDDDDALITDLIVAAEGHLESVGVDMEADPLPAPIDQAILLLVAHWYENREAVTGQPVTSLPFGVDALTAPYREVCL